jgi:predicted nuclease with TOPRIM domain
MSTLVSKEKFYAAILHHCRYTDELTEENEELQAEYDALQEKYESVEAAYIELLEFAGQQGAKLTKIQEILS